MRTRLRLVCRQTSLILYMINYPNHTHVHLSDMSFRSNWTSVPIQQNVSSRSLTRKKWYRWISADVNPCSGVKPFSIHPTILNLTLVTPPSITNIAKGAVDIIVPSSQPMTVREWDLLEEAVNALDGSWGQTEKQQGGGKIVICASQYIGPIRGLTIGSSWNPATTSYTPIIGLGKRRPIPTPPRENSTFVAAS